MKRGYKLPKTAMVRIGDGSWVFRVGKYKGKPPAKVPASYVQWALKEMKLSKKEKRILKARLGSKLRRKK